MLRQKYVPIYAEFYSLADESRKDFLDLEVGDLGILVRT